MNSVNSLYLIFSKANVYFGEKNGNKWLTLVPTNESEEKNKKYEELWIKIRDLIRSITKNSDDYDEKHIKFKFNLDDELPPNKTIEIPKVALIIRAVYHENGSLYQIKKWRVEMN